jgi:hypothetical protein
LKDVLGLGIPRSATINIIPRKTKTKAITWAIGLSFQETGDHGADIVDANIYFNRSDPRLIATCRRHIPAKVTTKQFSAPTTLQLYFTTQPTLRAMQFHPAHIPHNTRRGPRKRGKLLLAPPIPDSPRNTQSCQLLEMQKLKK